MRESEGGLGVLLFFINLVECKKNCLEASSLKMKRLQTSVVIR